jgi:hypothetical protein
MLSKMGYYNYQSGLIFRHLNQKGAWDQHLDICRRFIIKALDYYKPEKVTVLGSGWVLELPLAEMIERTYEICLIDIVHPPEVIKQAGSYKNVKILEQDVTGGLIEEVWQKTKRYSFFNKLKSLALIKVPEYRTDFDPGLLISLNILTQLETLLISFLKKRTNISEEEYNRFRSEIQRKHIDFLKKHRSVLISDTIEIFTENSGKVTEEQTLLTSLPEGTFRDEWDWDFDLTGSDFNTKRSILKVVGIII